MPNLSPEALMMVHVSSSTKENVNLPAFPGFSVLEPPLPEVTLPVK